MLSAEADRGKIPFAGRKYHRTQLLVANHSSPVFDMSLLSDHSRAAVSDKATAGVIMTSARTKFVGMNHHVIVCQVAHKVSIAYRIAKGSSSGRDLG